MTKRKRAKRHTVQEHTRYYYDKEGYTKSTIVRKHRRAGRRRHAS